MACGISCRAVHLRGVLAREGTAAVGALAAVGVDDDLAAGQTGVAVRAADHKLARGVNEIFDVVAEEREHLAAVYLLLHARHEDVDDVVTYLCEHLLVVGHELVVLGAHHDGVDALGHTLVAVLNGHLTLRVGTQIGHHLALAANVGERAHDELCQVKRHRHVVFCLVGGVTEHHALVAGTLLVLLLTADAAVDVAALLVDGGEDAA